MVTQTILDSVKKIQQHDPTEQKPTITLDEIDKIPHDTDDHERIDVKISLPYFVLKEFSNNIKRRFGTSGPRLNGYLEGRMMKWNKELELDHDVGSLSFGGSIPRTDVLIKLHKIASEFANEPGFPNFKRYEIETIIKKTIGDKDPRTFKKYLHCIVFFIELKRGTKIMYSGIYDVTGLREVIEEALSRVGN